MRRFLRLTKRQVALFLLFSMLMLYMYYAGMMPFTLLLFFELIFLIRFIDVRKYLELNVFSRHPHYARLPERAKWVLLLVVYLLVFMALKWVLANVVLEGIFHIPVSDELRDFSALTQAGGSSS